MRKGIKTMVGIRVFFALVSVLLYSILITINIYGIKDTQKRSIEANSLLERIQSAEVAHYKWASGLSNALYAGTEFTGSIDPTSCVLGQWVYGDKIENADILALSTADMDFDSPDEIKEALIERAKDGMYWIC